MSQRRILIPVDASARAQETFAWALSSFLTPEDHVTLVFVEEAFDDEPIFGGYNDLGDVYQRAKDENARKTKLLFQVYSKAAAEKNLTCEEVVLQGNPKNEILEYSQKTPFDMIILGNRGESVSERVYLGAVTDYILRNSKTPVVVYKPPPIRIK